MPADRVRRLNVASSGAQAPEAGGGEGAAEAIDLGIAPRRFLNPGYFASRVVRVARLDRLTSEREFLRRQNQTVSYNPVANILCCVSNRPLNAELGFSKA